MLCAIPIGLYIFRIQPHHYDKTAFEKVGVFAMFIRQTTIIVIQMTNFCISGHVLC